MEQFSCHVLHHPLNTSASSADSRQDQIRPSELEWFIVGGHCSPLAQHKANNLWAAIKNHHFSASQITVWIYYCLFFFFFKSGAIYNSDYEQVPFSSRTYHTSQFTEKLLLLLKHGSWSPAASLYGALMNDSSCAPPRYQGNSYRNTKHTQHEELILHSTCVASTVGDWWNTLLLFSSLPHLILAVTRTLCRADPSNF